MARAPRLDSPSTFARRVQEISRENIRAIAARTCPACGCSPASPRWAIRIDDQGSLGECVLRGTHGLEVCSACLTPEKRVGPAELLGEVIATVERELRAIDDELAALGSS